jgi:hypothetical protein
MAQLLLLPVLGGRLLLLQEGMAPVGLGGHRRDPLEATTAACATPCANTKT